MIPTGFFRSAFISQWPSLRQRSGPWTSGCLWWTSLLSLTQLPWNILKRTFPTSTSHQMLEWEALLLNLTRQIRATGHCRQLFLTSWPWFLILYSAPSCSLTENDWWRPGGCSSFSTQWSKTTGILFEPLPPSLLFAQQSKPVRTIYCLLPTSLFWREITSIYIVLWRDCVFVPGHGSDGGRLFDRQDQEEWPAKNARWHFASHCFSQIAVLVIGLYLDESVCGLR